MVGDGEGVAVALIAKHELAVGQWPCRAHDGAARHPA